MGQKVHPVGFRLQQHLKASNFAERVWQNLSFRFFWVSKKKTLMEIKKSFLVKNLS